MEQESVAFELDIEEISPKAAFLRIMLGAMMVFILMTLLHFMDQSALLETKLKQSLFEPRNIYLDNVAGESGFIIGITALGPQIALTDASNKKRVELVALQSSARLVIYDEAEEERATVVADDSGSLITLSNELGEAFALDLAQLGPGFDLFKDYQGLKLGSLTKNPGRLELKDEAGHVRVELNVTENQKQMAIFDSEGHPKAQLLLDDNEATVVLLDPEAKGRALIRLAEAESQVEILTASAKKRMSFSMGATGPVMTLFDEEEKPQELIGLTTDGTSLDLFGERQNAAITQPVAEATTTSPSEADVAPTPQGPVPHGDIPADLFAPDAIPPAQEVATEGKTPLDYPVGSSGNP